MSANGKPVELTGDFYEAAIELRAITNARRDLDEREKAAKALLAKHLTAGEVGTDAAGTPLVKVQAGARVWNEDAARANLPGDVLAGLTVTETITYVDKTRAKDVLAPALYDLCCKSNADSIKVA